MKLSIHLVTWNGAKYIPYLFESLGNQTFKDWSLLILDNGSRDGTVELIKKELNNLGVQAKLMENQENLGFAAGHNQLFRTYNLKPITYNLLLNQDMYLLPDCLEKLVKFIDEHPEAVAVSPRLMRWDFNRLQVTGYRLQDSFTDQIDSLGLKVLRSRRVVELCVGKIWDENVILNEAKRSEESLKFQRKGSFVRPGRTQDDMVMEVFGVSGALPMFRRSVIEKVGLFDELFGSYKEDVDLAFRLRSAGFKSYVVLDAVAFHDRSAVGALDLSDKTALANKKKQSDWIKYNSYKNHLITLYKNEYWQNFLLDFPWIFWYELKKFVYFLLFDRQVLGGVGEIWKNRAKVKSQKSKVKSLRQVDWKKMRKWWRKKN